MGTWGVDAFENDNAADWAFQLEEAEDLTLVRETLALVVRTSPRMMMLWTPTLPARRLRPRSHRAAEGKLGHSRCVLGASTSG